jgi:histidyl-tRNA synthetase
LLLEDATVPGDEPDAYLVRQGEAATRFASRAAEDLRNAGLSVVLHSGAGGFKAQMKRADASGARYAVIVGDDEAGTQTVSVKPLREDAQQVRVGLDEAIRLIKKGVSDTTSQIGRPR